METQRRPTNYKDYKFPIRMDPDNYIKLTAKGWPYKDDNSYNVKITPLTQAIT